MRKLHLLIALVLFIVGYLWLIPTLGEAGAGLTLLITIAWLWLTEALHVSITALLVPLLGTGLGVFTDYEEALVHFADPIIFLFLGGFALAAGLHAQGLDEQMASWVIRRAGGRLSRASRWLFWLTAILSMWISNTATAAMMLPLAMGLLAPIDIKAHRSTWVYVLLGVAFSANIGGIGTLVGSPPNAIAASNANLSFSDWMLWGLPIVLILMPLMELALRFALKPTLDIEVTLPEGQAQWGKGQVGVALVFCLTVVLWIFGHPIAKAIGFSHDADAAIAILALLLLQIFGLTRWQDLNESTDWGVLLLFGGGITLSAALSSSGAGEWLAQSMGNQLMALSPVIFLGLMILFAMLLTEVASNTATAALLIPLFMGMAPHIESTPMAVLVAIATSCAFLLPVATPPNAIIFGSGQVPQKSMIKAGSILTLLSLPALWLITWIVL
ncbi:Anion transporter [Terasakiispira papahanaumokuakeensis]|uniref:Anion transporter n=1 Tax=Terasakiispira papahanaumokuakeensis TaxID=197479 RepID=A0A1E2V975_9GAMM|nr:SLC13 family permease [Terasakiispira papahanaumokuakeensis]ODC03366.1 Anion transporter [Terasakiispira papahanaumokuakeensis]